MLGSGRLYDGTENVGPTHFETDGDDLDALAVDLCAQCLPPGQVEATASIGRPGGDGHLLPAERRQRDLFTGEHVGQGQFGRLSRGE
jgi:hypothetical protein